MVKLNLHLCFVFLEHTFYLSSLQNYKIIAFQKERNYFSFLWLCIQKIFIYIQADQNWAMNICYWTQWIDLWNSPATFFHGRYFRNNHPPPPEPRPPWHQLFVSVFGVRWLQITSGRHYQLNWPAKSTHSIFKSQRLKFVNRINSGLRDNFFVRLLKTWRIYVESNIHILEKNHYIKSHNFKK